MGNKDILTDTSIFIDHLRKKDKTLTLLAKSIKNYNEIYVSAITAFELYSGANNEIKKNDVNSLLGICKIIPFDIQVAEKSSEVYQFLKITNQIIEVRDLFIGCTALVFNLPVLTLNLNHFKRIPGLKVMGK